MQGTWSDMLFIDAVSSCSFLQASQLVSRHLVAQLNKAHGFSERFFWAFGSDQSLWHCLRVPLSENGSYMPF